MAHSASSTSAGFDQVGGEPQRPVMPSLARTWLTGPVPGLKQEDERERAATGGTRDGR